MKLPSENIGKVQKDIETRNAVLMSGLALAAVIKPVSADNQNATVKGTVYEDKNE